MLHLRFRRTYQTVLLELYFVVRIVLEILRASRLEVGSKDQGA